MGDPAMTIREEDVRRISDYVRPWLRDMVFDMTRRSDERDTRLLERMVRVEEELKAQRELMAERFAGMDARFETLQTQMDKRFDAVDKRFETMQQQMDQRFDALIRRIDRFMVWSFATTLTVGGLVVAALKLWP